MNLMNIGPFYQIMNSNASCGVWIATLINIGPYFFMNSDPFLDYE